MVNAPVNATGWTELINGHMVSAVYTMFDTAFGSIGLVVVILFLVYQIMLYMKTKNITITWVMGIFFMSLYGLSTFVETFSKSLIFVILVLELSGIFILLFVNKK